MIPNEGSRGVTIAWTIAALAATGWYFGWLLRPERPGVMWLFALLLVADLFNGFHALSFWATCLRRRPERLFRAPHRPRVDVLIPTLNEPEDILIETVRGARSIRGAEVRVFLLDDGNRRQIAEMARLHGAYYIPRPDGRGAKAGNLNHALAATADGGAEFVCVFDADHVPQEEFAERTLGYFADPQVALVQTPQVYGNADAGPLTRAAAEQQAIFFGPICVGRDGWNATFCCGTNFVARRAALEEVGGFPEDSITEDIVMSIHLAGRGWKLVYEPTPLSVGLGPEDAVSYLKQQRRWAAGCLELLLRRSSALRPLTAVQRWQYVVATSYWLTGWTFVVYLSLPVARLLFDAPVIRDPSSEFALHFFPYFLLAVVSLGRFSLGAYSVRGLVLNWGCFSVHIGASLAVLARRPGGFAVTSKRAVTGMPWGRLLPNLVASAVLAGASAYALAHEVTPAVLGNVSFALMAIALVLPIVAFSGVQARRAKAIDAREGADSGDTLRPAPTRALRPRFSAPRRIPVEGESR